ncbi:MAG: hypothetical protein ACD_61C00127G0002 [uncultured bacterium]|nr:MAG: hypothetical protein ACD_61C00127G0002 [uncultured bacterium]
MKEIVQRKLHHPVTVRIILPGLNIGVIVISRNQKIDPFFNKVAADGSSVRLTEGVPVGYRIVDLVESQKESED